MHQQSSPEVRFSNDGNSRPRLDVLRQKLGQDDLLGEKLRANRNFGLRGILAAKAEQKDAEATCRAKSQPRKAPHLHTTLKRRSSNPRKKSASSAKSAAGIAPARINESLTSATPRKINVPSPPAPMAAPMVAMPIVRTVAVRMPARIIESASGKRTRNMICAGVMPIASAASKTAGSTPLNPT